MKYGSVCSGIECASAAWEALGWEPQFFSEIEPVPCSVLAHHYPDVPNYGDMTKFKEWPDHAIDVLIGGTPCQSYSVAGLRAGLDDPRGNLMLTYVAIARKYRPKLLTWENVPGVLSSNKGRDFGSLLGLLTGQHIECPPTGWQNSGVVPGYAGAYGIAWRVLDAQYVRVESHPRAVPQRRRRVFVVGYLGDWRRAAAVLLERESMLGHPAPVRKAGQGFTSYAPSSFGGYSEGVGTLRKEGGDGAYNNVLCISTGQASAEIGIGIGTTINCNHEAPIVVIPPIGLDEEQNATIDYYGTLKARTKGGGFEGAVAVAFQERGGRKDGVHLEIGGDVAYALTSPKDGGRSQERNIMHGMVVRRLLPVECARLMGFKDDYLSQVKHKGKPIADGPMYKAFGNGMALNPVYWIGKRIEMADKL